jgi:hypothetical protein
MIEVSEWTSTVRARIRQVQNGLLSTARWAASADAAVMDQLTEPYREMLDSLYQRDVPLARLADESDLLLHVRGPAASAPSPRVSTVTKLLTMTRDEVTRLAKNLAGVTAPRVPAGLDMDLVGIAGGSLFVGFSAAGNSDDAPFTRQAVAAIGAMGALIEGEANLDDITDRFSDPAERDITVAAVRHLSPSGQIGIREIDVYCRHVAQAVTLTTETRRHARRLLSQQPTHRAQRITLVGTVREVDLDAARFEIRNVEGRVEAVRCAHELEERDVKELVDRRVRVSGAAELGVGGQVRLLWVDEVERLD